MTLSNFIYLQSQSPWSDFFSNPGSFIDVQSVVTKTILLSELLVGIFLMVNIGMNYVNTFIKEGHKGKFYDPAELKRVLIVAIMVPIIPGIFYAIENVGLVSAGYFEMTFSEKSAAINKINAKIMEDQKSITVK